MTDAELVRATLAGSRDAYAEIARRWSARVTAVCHARVRKADVADDMAQETLLRGFRALHSLSDPAKVGTWLMGIGMRASLDWLKARAEAVSEVMAWHQARVRLKAALEALAWECLSDGNR